MINILKDKKRIKEFIPILIIIGITILVCFPLFKKNLLNGHDAMFHLFRFNSLKVAMSDSALLPLVNPYMMGGLGYASNMFYGILTSYLGLFLNLFTGSLGAASNTLVILSIFFSGLFMYLFLRDISSNKYISLLGSVIYMAFPYHLFDIYVRMAFGEIISFVFIPLIFWGLYNIINQEGNKWFLLSLGASGLLLTHNISAFMVIIFAFLYLMLNLQKIVNKKVFLKLAKSLIFPLLISLITITPILEAKFRSDYMVFDHKYMNTTGTNMEKTAINILSGNNYLVNTARVSLVITFILIISYFYLKKHRSLKQDILKSFLILLSLSLIFTLNIIPWHLLPNALCMFQFPWRYLQMTCFFIAASLSLAVTHINSNIIKKIFFCLVLVSLFFNIPLLKMGINNGGINNDMVMFNRIKKQDDIARSTGTASAEYLPRNAIYNYEYLVKRKLVPLIISGAGTIKNIQKNGTNLNFDLISNRNVNIELPYIYYPGYQVLSNNKKLKTYETENGLVGIRALEGESHIEVKYCGTIFMIISYFLGGGAFIALIVIIIKEKRGENSKA